jgi:indolepyruvate decarboxylase
MVVISGAPPSRNYKPNDLALPHHVLKGNMMSQMQAFHPVTTAATLLLTADGAAERIDETLCQSIAQCLPVLIEIPSDVAAMPIVGAAEKLAREPVSLWPTAPPHSSEACAAAVDRCRDALLAASRPALLVGLEVVRRGAQRSTRRLAQMLRLPVATTRHGKTAIEEGGTVCAGVYAGGGHSSEPVRNYVEGADVLLMLGAPKTECALSGRTPSRPARQRAPLPCSMRSPAMSVITA